jgi:aspartate carbamoyltransferase regulatory subunit
MSKTFKVSSIQNGTVIDHIYCGRALQILRLLKLAQHKKQVSLGLNLESKSLGSKDLIKVEDKELSPDEVKQIAVFSPNITLNIIENHKVKKKILLSSPEFIRDFLYCPNSNCITSSESIKSSFEVLIRQKSSNLRCCYCEKVFSLEKICKNNK